MSLGDQTWFYIVFMGSSTCPFLAYIVPAYLYKDLMHKKGNTAYVASTFVIFGVLMMVFYTSISMFAWHVKNYIKVFFA